MLPHAHCPPQHCRSRHRSDLLRWDSLLRIVVVVGVLMLMLMLMPRLALVLLLLLLFRHWLV